MLGPLAVDADGREVHVAGSHRRRLLALLASRPGRMLSVDAIIDALWGEDPPPTAGKTVQSHVVRLRRSLAAADAELIETVHGGYRLNVDPAAVDAVRFERLAADGRRELARGAAGAAAAMLGEALGLWRGPAFGEFGDAEFAAAERVRLDELRLRAMEDLAEAQLASGAAAVPIPELERLVVEEPGRERAWALLMRALYAAGRQHHALVTYQRARRTLAESFGLEPGPELRALERQVLDQDPALIVASDRPALPAALRTTGPLVGRDAELAWLAEAWELARRGPARFGCSSARLTAVAPGWPPSSPPGDRRGRLGRVRAGRCRPRRSHAGLAGNAGTARRGRRRSHRPLPPRAPAPRGGRRRVDAAQPVSRRSRRWPAPPNGSRFCWCLIADPAGGGAAVDALRRLPTAATTTLGPLDDEALADLVAADGVDAEGVAAILAVAGGLPGVARREAAAGRSVPPATGSQAAAASSIDATAVAGVAPSASDVRRRPRPRRRPGQTRRTDVARRGWAASRTAPSPPTGPTTPTCSSAASGSSPSWRRGCWTGGSSRSSARRAAASRRSFGPGSCRSCAAGGCPAPARGAPA